jgi:hypothetical protein
MANIDETTRVFFVVDSYERNEEIHDALDAAEDDYEYLKQQTEEVEGYDRPISEGARLYIALVRHAYREKDRAWNYEDFSDTFEIIKVVHGKTATPRRRL